MTAMDHYRAGYVAGCKGSVDNHDPDDMGMEYASDMVEQEPDYRDDDLDHCMNAAGRIADLWASGYRAGLASGIRIINV